MAHNVHAVHQQNEAPGHVGDHHVGWFGLLTTLGILVAVGIGAVYAFVQFLPPAPSGTAIGADQLPDVQVFGASVSLSRDGRLFVVVAMAGAFGATIHALQSLVWYAGNRVLKRSWLPMYYAMPLTGALVGVVFYLVLRGGLLAPTATAADASPYGFSAVAAVVGLFLSQALEKLKGVFETLFTTAPKGEDHKGPE